MEYYDPLKNNKVNLYEFGKISRKYCKGKKLGAEQCILYTTFLLSITVLVNLFLIITPPRSLFKTFFS